MDCDDRDGCIVMFGLCSSSVVYRYDYRLCNRRNLMC